MVKKDRPLDVEATTYKIRTGCGSLYIIIGAVGGEMFEVFGNLGKAGGCAAAQVQALGRVVSKALQFGVPATELARTLKGIGCHRPGWLDEKHETVLSCADAIAIAMQRAIDNQRLKVDEEEQGGPDD